MTVQRPTMELPYKYLTHTHTHYCYYTCTHSTHTPHTPHTLHTPHTHTHTHTPHTFHTSLRHNCIFPPLLQHWTNLWVVLHAEKSPSFCFIGHCKKETDWLANNKIEKVFLGEAFEVKKMETGYSRKFEPILQVAFKSYRIDLAFDSITKMEVWYKALEAINSECPCDMSGWILF